MNLAKKGANFVFLQFLEKRLLKINIIHRPLYYFHPGFILLFSAEYRVYFINVCYIMLSS